MKNPNESKPYGKLSASYKIHRSQAAWQIFIPIGLAVVAVIVVAVLAAQSTFRNPADGTLYSSISLIWILLPPLIAGFLMAVVLAAMVFGLGKLLEILPKYTWVAQQYVSLVPRFVKIYADKILVPVLLLRGWAAGFSVLKQRIRIHDIVSTK